MKHDAPHRLSGKRQILLVSSVGFAHGWAPLGISLIKSYLAAHTPFSAETLSLCLKFSQFIAREEPGLAEYDRQMGEWGSSFHELYFSAHYFNHADTDVIIKEVAADYVEGGDIFRQPPWTPKRTASSALIDFHAERMITLCRLIDSFSRNEMENALREMQPSIIGFSLTVQQVFSSAMLARLVKRLSPSTIIVFGGPAILPRTAAFYRNLFPEVDYFVYGDGEEALRAIAEHVIDGLPIKMEGGIVERAGPATTALRPAKQPALDAVPFADFDELGDFYRRSGFPLTTWIGRGCSWGKCRFCSIPDFQRLLLDRPISDLYREVCHLKERYHTSSIRFGDWEVNGSQQDLMEFCRMVIEGRHQFQFWGEVNARKLTPELMDMMKRAGFASLQVGLEAFSDNLLRKMNKPATLIDNIRCMMLAHEFKIELFSNILFNFPGETRDDVIDTLRVIKMIRHLLATPVRLALIEFLLETDADVYQSVEGGEELSGYRFESRCLPESQRALGPYFLKQWTPPPDPLWAQVHREIEKCQAGSFYFNHFLEGEAVYLEDGRDGEVEGVKLTGPPARVYSALLKGPVTAVDLRESCGELSMSEVTQCLERFIQSRWVLKHRQKYLSLSLGVKSR